MKLIRIHPMDNVAVALTDIPAGEHLTVDGTEVTAAENIARGHKIALGTIREGEPVVKYGNPIGIAKAEIPAGVELYGIEEKEGKIELNFYDGNTLLSYEVEVIAATNKVKEIEIKGSKYRIIFSNVENRNKATKYI